MTGAGHVGRAPLGDLHTVITAPITVSTFGVQVGVL
jgi:hypothetical protein